MDVTKEPSELNSSATSQAPGLELLVWLMDHALRVPGTQIRVGLDAILGLVPLGGDFVTGIVQVGIVLVAMTRYRVPKAVAARMAGNVLLDVAVGVIPILGDLFDVAFKANTRNLHLLRDYEREVAIGATTVERSSLRFVLMLVTIFIVTLSLVLVGFIVVVGWILRRLH